MRYVIIAIIILMQSAVFATRPEKHILDNGLTLVLKESPGTGLVGISLFVDASSLNESYKEAGLVSLVGAMLREGTKNRSAEGLAEELESTGAVLGVENSSDYTELSYLSLSKDIELGFDILNDVLNNAVFPEKELKKRKDDVIAGIKTLDDNPSALIHDELLHLVYKKHPYGIKSKSKLINIKRFTILLL